MFFIIYNSEPPVECLEFRYKLALALSLKCPHKPHCFQLFHSPWIRVMPKVTLAGLSSWACLGTSAAMSKYCFWLSHRWLCCGIIELGTIFTSVGQTVLTCKTMPLSRGLPAAERGSNCWRVRSKHTSSSFVSIVT